MVAKKLLVADDSLTIQKVIRLALSNEGYEIQAVSDGNDAVQQISVFRPDVILIDVSLPGQNACEVKRAINQLPDLEHVRFILMSSAFERVDEPQVQAVEFHGRLTKPFDPAHLRQTLVKVLETAPAAKPTVAPITDTSTYPSPGNPLNVDNPFTFPLTPPAGPAEVIPGIHLELPLETLSDPLEPIQPIEPPPLPNLVSVPTPPRVKPEAPVHDLWNDRGTATPMMPPAPPIQRESDIRDLTEKTVKMSGLEDFAWTVSEPSIKPSEPLMRPPTKLIDVGNSNFELEIESPFETSAPSSMSASGPTSSVLEKPVADDPSNIIPVSMTQIEEIIKKQVRETLEKIAPQLLSDVAERLIKEEIHKMLSEH